MSYLPTSELVGLYWIKGLAEWVNPDLVGTVLPGPDANNNLTWGASAFVQLTVVGGSRDVHVPRVESVLSVDVWAANQHKKRAPWARAEQVAELIARACWDLADVPEFYARPVVTRDGYRDAKVLNASAGVPARRPSDTSNYAHFGFELSLTWVTLDT